MSTAATSAMGVVLGLAFLLSAGVRAYRGFGGETLMYFRLASQATVGACLVFYFALGKLKPIRFADAEMPSRAALHGRPGFAKVGRNPVLAKYLKNA